MHSYTSSLDISSIEISSLDIYAHPFNHRFFNCGSYSDVISKYHQGSQPDSLMFLPFNYDFKTGTLGQIEDFTSLHGQGETFDVFGIAEEIALAVFENSDDEQFDDMSIDTVNLEVEQELPPSPATSVESSFSFPPLSAYSFTTPAHLSHSPHSQRTSTCSHGDDSNTTSPRPLTYAQVVSALLKIQH